MLFILKSIKDEMISGKLCAIWVVQTTSLMPLKNLEI